MSDLKLVDLSTQADLVQMAIMRHCAQHGGPMPMYEEPGPEVYVYPAYAVICTDAGDYQIPYSINEHDVTLAPMDAWVQVVKTWVAASDPQPFPQDGMDNMKAGRAISSMNMQRIQAMHEMTKEMGAQCQPAHDTRPIKAGVLDVETSDITPYASMKAVGDRLLEVRVAYYGHKNGKDSHDEYFSPNTDFDPENFPAPPLLYYHGFDANGKKMGRPAVTGKFASRRVGTDGHYLTYKLKNTKYADAQWDAAQSQKCVVSPGTIGHLIRKDAKTGELLYWPLAEISAWDYAPNRAPANLHSVAAPVLKALYAGEGLTPPAILETAASDHSPEVGGDPAGDPGAVASLPSDQAGSVIAAEIARALYNLRRNPTT